MNWLCKIFIPGTKVQCTTYASNTTLTLQITPSQSKMKTSTPGNKSFAGSVNFSTLALSAVVAMLDDKLVLMTLLLFLLNDEEEEDNVRDEKVRAAGEKARTVNDDDAARATARADFAMFMIPIGRY